MSNEEKLAQLRERLKRAYAAEQAALESQSTSNAEGEQHSFASLSQIQSLIKDLESQIAAIEGGGVSSVTMAWSMPA